jgi:two-component system chemotaxis sensor kinase CheA
MVLECTDLSEDIDVTKEGGDFFNIRGEVIPFVKLYELFKDTHERPKRENIVVVEYARKRAGFMVDRLLGEFQTVIKPLGRLFRNLKWISGATILGNGKIAFILDVPRLTEFMQQKIMVKDTHG